MVSYFLEIVLEKGVGVKKSYSNSLNESDFPVCCVQKNTKTGMLEIVDGNNCFKKDFFKPRNELFFGFFDLKKSVFLEFLENETVFYIEGDCFLPTGEEKSFLCQKMGGRLFFSLFPASQDKMQKLSMDTLGHFAGGIAHDFNNILSIILGYARGLRDEDLSESEIKTYLEKIQSATKKGANLTKQLLAFSKQKVILGECKDINTAIQDQVDLCKVVLGAGVNVHFSPSQEALPVECSEDVIGQIVMNLLINARDSIQDTETGQGDIWVEASFSRFSTQKHLYPHGVAKIVIKDSGGGMSQSVMSHAFDPFFTTKAPGKGVGLGLSSVHGVVSQLGGEIRVSSRENGSSFVIHLPLAYPVKEKVVIESMLLNDKVDRSLEGKTILIAEDEVDLASLLQRSFEGIGMNVLLSYSGRQALNLAEKYKGTIDFLLTDIVMPEMHGMHLGRELIVLHPETYVIYMSGYPGRESFGYQIDLPKECYVLSKPLEMQTIIAVMTRVLQGESAADLEQFYKSLDCCF